MKWHVEPWRKSYINKSPSWLRMSVSARGLGRELVTYVDDQGCIDIGSDAPATAIIYMLGARPKEHKRIGEDVKELLAGKDPYLIHEGSVLRIRNFVPAQDRTPGAKRTAAWRARQEEKADRVIDETLRGTSHVTPQETSPELSQVTHGETSRVHSDETWDRDVSCRDERSQPEPSPPPLPPGGPDGGGVAGLIGTELRRSPMTAFVAKDEALVQLLATKAVDLRLKPESVAEAFAWARDELAMQSARIGGGLPLNDEATMGVLMRGLRGGATRQARPRATRPAASTPRSKVQPGPDVWRDGGGFE